MQFLKTLFWALLIGIGVAFAFNNWFSVEIHLWGGLIAEVNLPLLLLVTFLLGLLPTLIAYHALRWRLRQRIATSERALSDLRAAHTAGPVAYSEVSPEPSVHTITPTPTGDLAGDGPLFDRGSAK